MDESSTDQTVTLQLEHAEALVLFEWLSRRDDPEASRELSPFAAATQRVHWDLECTLEASLPDVFAPDYDARLATAIDEVRDEPGIED